MINTHLSKVLPAEFRAVHQRGRAGWFGAWNHKSQHNSPKQEELQDQHGGGKLLVLEGAHLKGQRQRAWRVLQHMSPCVFAVVVVVVDVSSRVEVSATLHIFK